MNNRGRRTNRICPKEYKFLANRQRYRVGDDDNQYHKCTGLGNFTDFTRMSGSFLERVEFPTYKVRAKSDNEQIVIL